MINKNWSFRRGDIYLADLGEHHGHIQGGARPVVVVQNDYGNRFAPTLIVVPLTTEIKKADMPTHYVLRHQRGLDKPCMALAEQIQTIRKSQIIRYLGHMRPIHMSCIDLGIRESIGLPPQHIIRIIPPNEQKGVIFMQNIDSIPISTDKRCYTVAELQKMLGISRGSVYQLLKTGQFHWFKIGTAIRISKQSFDEWLNGQSC